MTGQTARSMFRIVLLVLLLVSLVGGPALPVDARPPASAIEQSAALQVDQPQASLLNILDIPQVQAAPKIDASCSDYSLAFATSFLDGNGKTGTVYTMFLQGILYVCMQAQPGTFANRFARLYLDPQADGSSYVFANKQDFALQLDLNGTGRSSYRGTDVSNGWTLDASLDAFWTGLAASSKTADTAEWAVETGRFFFNPCSLFGMAVYHHWFKAVGDDYGMPSGQWYDQPGTWQLARMYSPVCTDKPGRIAYVFRGDMPSATSFYNLMVGAGYSVTLVPLAAVLGTNFSGFTLIVIADDTGSLNEWGTSGLTASQVAQIKAANKPTIGLGEGGYAFFGQLAEFIGWPNGWHGPQQSFNNTGLIPAFFNLVAGSPVDAYVSAQNSVGIYLGNAIPVNVTPVALEVPTKDHASLILQDCHLLWGNGGNPLVMTPDGKQIFINGLGYMNTFQCFTPPPPPTGACINIVKTASPAGGAAVAPGQVIKYTVTVTFSNNPDCKNTAAKLVDSIPIDTTFVPGSATDGISPGPDGALIWIITPSASPIVKTFEVVVSQNQCDNQRTVNNRAGLLVSGYDPFISNVVSHPVTCPPVGFPNDQPSFAEDEIQIHPYPLVTGTPSEIKVRVSNYTAIAQTVHVAFQTSADRFGIGLSFSSFDTQTVTIPAHGNVIVSTFFTPVSSGHYCIQVMVTGPGLAQPLLTQHNIDVTEDLQPGVRDDLVFKVGNPTAATATINLVVDNTCPGWTASVNPAVLLNMAPGEVRNATLSVTPPDPVTLGTVCHIDVQGWIGATLIGGIRKLDVPPVQLPPDVNPPWEEPEISTIPSPLAAGQHGQACIFLQNPMGTSRTVTLEYAEADFGAGVGFTKFAEQTVTLPPYSAANYCVSYTPGTTGTVHKCLLVTLKQAGAQDQSSQRNIDLVRPLPQLINLIDIPFVIHNPDVVTHGLVISTTVYGIDPYWQPKILTDPGDPPPASLLGDGSVRLHLGFTGGMGAAGAAGAAPEAPPLNYSYGDVSQVQVSIYLDGELLSGFTVELDTGHLFLPIIAR
jgi:uncharacterized repeat protein (TIGR01451 family)